MRRTLPAAALAVGALLVVTGCAEDAPSTAGSGGGTSTEAAGCGNEVTIDEVTSVGLAFDSGGRGDLSFNDATVAGLEQAQEEIGFESTELSPNADGSNRGDLLRQLADAGNNPIIGNGFQFSEDMDTVAAEYPDTQFIRIDGGPSDCANVAVLTFAEPQGSFLVGAAAALTSETGVVGYVGANTSELIEGFRAGYTQGAQAVNPDVEVLTATLEPGPEDGYNDPAAARVAAEAQIEQGADVLYHASGSSGVGVFEAAAAADVWGIGVDQDQYNTIGDPALAEHILTSMLKNLDAAVYESLTTIVDEGSVDSQNLTLAEDGVGYSTTGGFVDDLVPQLDEYKQQIIDGEIEVSATPAS